VSIQIGDVRAEFEAQLRNSLADIMAAKAAQGLHHFYVLVYVAWVDSDQLRTRFVIQKDRPVPMLGTCCYKVSDGKLYNCWILPRDNFLIPDSIRTSVNPTIERGVQNLRMPIV
jgi:hypothetical protein